MFCKWCGADLSNTVAKCPRCGKDVPAKSDCGGFYDLVPKAKRPVVEDPVSQPAPPKPDLIYKDPEKIDFTKKETLHKSKKDSGRKGAGFQLIVSVVGFVIVITLLLSLSRKLDAISIQLDDISNRVDNIVAEMQKILESSDQDTTTPSAEDTVADDVGDEGGNTTPSAVEDATEGVGDEGGNTTPSAVEDATEGEGDEGGNTTPSAVEEASSDEGNAELDDMESE